MAFNRKRIDLSFALGKGASGESGFETITIRGLRISARITAAGTDANECSMQISGLSKDLMNQLSMVGMQANTVRNNSVLVEAGDDINGMNVVFQGTITYAWPDFQAAPQVVMRIDGRTGSFAGVRPVQPTSFEGAVPVGTIIKSIAGKMNRSAEITGDLGMLTDPYFYGSAMSQMKALGKAGRFGWIDDNQYAIAAWPRNKPRAGGDGKLISKETGMVGSPIGTPTGCIVKQLFSKPNIFGTEIEVVSENIEKASGRWIINRVDYSLESEMPHGEWFTTLDAYGFNPSNGG